MAAPVGMKRKGTHRTPDVVCAGGTYDPNCPKCRMQPIVFEWETAPTCQFCGAPLTKRLQEG